MEPLNALKKYFSYDRFRHPQEQVVESILKGWDTLVIMPTGGGKSLCYQLPAMLLPGVTVVVSPLIALMKDQVDALRVRKLPAALINSSQSWPEQRDTLDAVRRGEVRLLYVSPERFQAQSFMAVLSTVKIAMMAIDEAHCISQWGHDFRPDYLRLGRVLDSLGRPLCAAFTATATPDVREDIVRQLGLRKPTTFIAGFARPNLAFNVVRVERMIEKERRLRDLIRAERNGIVYCATRKSVEQVSAGLRQDGIAHTVYHGGLNASQREEAQNAFVNKIVPVAVATNAFGMGIDRDDLRFICHYEMPGSIEAYYQEAGRAGRDGLPARCEFYFLYADKRIQEFFIDGANPDLALVRQVYATLRRLADHEGTVLASVDDLTAGLPGRINPMAVSTALGVLRREGLVDRFDLPGSTMRGTRLLQPEVGPEKVVLPPGLLEEKRSRDEARLKAVIQYAYAHECRQQWILRYFGEAGPEPCGRCDVCRESEVNPPRVLTEEQLIIVRKALSGVARMSRRIDAHVWEPRFGRDRIIKCLLGSAAAPIVQAGLNQLSTWGILKGLDNRFLGRLFDAMQRAELVAVSEGEFPLLGLTETGSRVMLGEVVPTLVWPDNSSSAGKPVRSAPGKGPGFDDESSELYQKLVLLRNKLRIERGNVPAYTLFPNTVLRELAVRQATTTEDALQINGIGPHKAKTVLPPFLKAIADHLSKNDKSG